MWFGGFDRFVVLRFVGDRSSGLGLEGLLCCVLGLCLILMNLLICLLFSSCWLRRFWILYVVLVDLRELVCCCVLFPFCCGLELVWVLVCV